MLKRTYPEQVCSIARALEAVGERWSLLIVRDLMIGFHRFDELTERLAISSNVLATRLDRLAELGIVTRRAYSKRPRRYEYHLTSKGYDLWPVLHGLGMWGDRYLSDQKPPVGLNHRDCGGTITPQRMCDRCGAEVDGQEVVFTPAVRARRGRTLGASSR